MENAQKKTELKKYLQKYINIKAYTHESKNKELALQNLKSNER